MINVSNRARGGEDNAAVAHARGGALAAVGPAAGEMEAVARMAAGKVGDVGIDDREAEEEEAEEEVLRIGVA